MDTWICAGYLKNKTNRFVEWIVLTMTLKYSQNITACFHYLLSSFYKMYFNFRLCLLLNVWLKKESREFCFPVVRINRTPLQILPKSIQLYFSQHEKHYGTLLTRSEVVGEIKLFYSRPQNIYSEKWKLVPSLTHTGAVRSNAVFSFRDHFC